MQNGDRIAIVKDLEEMESQGHPILKVIGEINQLGIGNVKTCRVHERYSRKSELIE